MLADQAIPAGSLPGHDQADLEFLQDGLFAAIGQPVRFRHPHKK